MDPHVGEVFVRYGEVLTVALPRMALLAALGGVCGWWLGGDRARSLLIPRARRIAWIVLALSLATGWALTLSRLSLVDDAFISFRYADHLARGHGLVYNVGERVEGYTNFLWTATLAGAAAVGFPIPETSIVLTLAALLATLTVTHALGRRLAVDAPDAPPVPLAAPLLAVQAVFVSYGSTGMETMPGALLVVAAGILLVRANGPREGAAAGLLLALAVLNRPDGALFAAAGFAAVIVRTSDRSLADRARWLLAFAAPFSLVVAHLAWRWAYYGALVPNTFYAKAVGESQTEQGLVYVASWLLGSGFWTVLALAAGWLVVRSGDLRVRAVKTYIAIGVAAHLAYVVYVGGDFMHGRFLVPLMPLLAVAAEATVRRGWAFAIRSGRPAPRALAALFVAALVGTACGSGLIERGGERWWICEVSGTSPVIALSPLTVDHADARAGRLLRRTFTDRGLTPMIAAHSIGMVGYYSRLPLLDLFGLADPVIANSPSAYPGKPGHGKMATRAYTLARGAKLIHGHVHPPQYRRIARIRLPGPTGERVHWHWLVYDAELAAKVAERSPEVGFVRFEAFLDRYLATLADRSADQVAADLAWFDEYYFDHNDDPERRAPIETRAIDR